MSINPGGNLCLCDPLRIDVGSSVQGSSCRGPCRMCNIQEHRVQLKGELLDAWREHFALPPRLMMGSMWYGIMCCVAKAAAG